MAKGLRIEVIGNVGTSYRISSDKVTMSLMDKEDYKVKL